MEILHDVASARFEIGQVRHPIANRLKIIRITLVAAVIVALISLGYSALKRGLLDEAAGPPPAGQTTDMPAAGP